MLTLSRNEIKELASDGPVYFRGLDYYTRGRVKNFRYSPEQLLIQAIVSGSKNYRVRIELYDSGDVADYQCTCPAYEQYNGACKHIIAVLLKALDKSANGPTAQIYTFPGMDRPISKLQPVSRPGIIYSDIQPREDPRLALSKAMVAGLINKSMVNEAKEPVHLEVTLYLVPTNRSLPYFELKIGQQRLYVIKSMAELLEAILNHRDLYFGKTFTFQPSRQHFLPPEQQFIQFLLDVYQDERSKNFFYSTIFAKHNFELNPTQFKRFLEIAPELEHAYWIKNQDARPVRLQTCREALPLTLQLSQGKEHLQLQLHTPEPLHELAFCRGIFVCGDSFFIPPADYLLPLQPVLEAFAKIPAQQLPLTDDDAAAFISEGIPVIREACRLEIAPEVERRLHREPLSISVWLDKHESGISAKVLFKYGEAIAINPLKSSHYQNEEKLLLRDKTGETCFLSQLMASGFHADGDSYQLHGEPQIYRFLREALPEILEKALVYRSESFDSLRIKRPPRFSGAIRLDEASDLLEVSFQMDDLPETELPELLAALQEKRKYFRLKTGAFIPLDEPETLAAGKFLAELGLTGAELQNRLVELPKYRALYLERVLREYGRERFHLNHAFKQLIRDVKEPQDMEWTIPEHLAGILRDYQKTGFKWLKTLSHYGFGGILADDMGLGKTLQIIALVNAEYPETRLPSLVIAPSSLVYNWREEIIRFAPELPALILDGQKPERLQLLAQASDYAFVITSYPLIRRDIEAMKDLQFSYCFLDEAQNIKNPATINAKSVKQIKARRYFAVTGTPIENSLTELWSIFDFIMPGYLYSHHKFQSRFETPAVRNNDAAALEDLGRHIRPFILRRLKRDVLAELPEKIETKLSCEMTTEQKKIYLAYLARARDEFESEIATGGFEKSRIKILALLTRLRQICCHPSLFLEDYQGGSGKLELLEEVIQDSLSGGHRILLFSQFVSMLDLIAARLGQDQTRFFRIDGQTPPEERLKLVNDFNQGNAEVFLISLKAGGTGLNLTGADMVIHYDPWWNPAVEDQATDRAYRIGQKNAVQVFKLVTHGAIEEKIYAMQQKKKELVDAVIQPGENLLGRMTLEEIRGLFE
jgi:SNF2 family DNA or RNA helicase